MGRQHSTLDVVPILNLVSIGVPFVVMSMWFATPLVMHDHAALAEAVFDTDLPEVVDLRVVIGNDGFVVEGAEEALGSSGAVLSCGDCARTRDYNVSGLTRLLGVVKDRYPDVETIVIVPRPDVPYDLLMATMDACRNDGPRTLFPNTLVKGEAVPDPALEAPAD